MWVFGSVQRLLIGLLALVALLFWLYLNVQISMWGVMSARNAEIE